MLSFFVGCKEDNTQPESLIETESLVVPESSSIEPTFVGNSVTLKGQGFTSESQIWLRKSIAKSGDDVQATVTGTTDESITFVAPPVVGEQDVVLKQDGSEQVLGQLFFAKEEVYGIAVNYEEENVYLVKYDAKTGTINKHSDINAVLVPTLSCNVIALNNAIYYSGVYATSPEDQQFGIFKYDLKTNTTSTILVSTLDTYEDYILYLIDGLPHAIVHKPDLIDTYSSRCTFDLINLSNGTKELVKTFGPIEIDGLHPRLSSNISYDEKTNRILVNGSLLNRLKSKSYHVFVSFPVKNGELKTLLIEKTPNSSSSSALAFGNKAYKADSFFDNVPVGDGIFSSILSHVDYYDLNPETLKVGTTKLGMGTTSFQNALYLKSLNKVFVSDVSSSPTSSSTISYIYDIEAEGEKISKITSNDVVCFCVMETKE